jgi:GNAT superfamily N-acetyltransferase
MYEMCIEVRKIDTPSKKKLMWSIFEQHHYMSAKLNVASDCFVGYLWGNPVAFYGCLPYPSGSVKNAYRGHRLVVLPDYQGMGIGNNFSEAVAQYYLNRGCRFFEKTANIKLGRYRNGSSKWRPTSKNMTRRKDVAGSERRVYNNITNKSIAMRLCYSHEYIGNQQRKENAHV